MKKYGPVTDLNSYQGSLKQAFSEGNLSEEGFFKLALEATDEIYLKQKEPWAQSGHCGDALSYRYKKMLITEAIYKSGSFLDIGSANGYLIHCLTAWMKNSSLDMSFYGLEISPALTTLSKKLWTKLKRNFFCGNALSWKPEFKFDYVYSMILPDLPESLHEMFIGRIMEDYLLPKGRLILGEYKIEDIEQRLIDLGYEISGYCEKSMNHGRIKKIIWIDKN